MCRKTKEELRWELVLGSHVLKVYYPKEDLWHLLVNGLHAGVYTCGDLERQAQHACDALDTIAYHTIIRDEMNYGVGTEYAIPAILNLEE